MFQYCNYQNREIVWAKLSNYPWWPARIVNSFQQDDQIVYKVSFFGDPTYCFLHQDNLLHFKDLDPASEQYSVSYSKLKKPVQLATAAFSKKLNQQNTSQNSSKSYIQTQQPQPKSQQQQNIEEREHAFIQTSFNEQQQQPQQPKKQILQNLINFSVSKDTVIEILQTGIVSKLRSFKGYVHKKITHQILHNLQNNLLSKYNLSNLQKPEKIKPIRKQLHHFKKIHMKKHQTLKNRNQCSIKKLCIRKMFQQLKPKSFTTFQAQQLSIKIVDKLEQQGPGYSDQFKKIFVVFMKWMNRVDKIHIQNFEVSFFQTFGITKKQDHQNSKITDVGSFP